MKKVYEQAKKYNLNFVIQEIKNIEKEKSGFVIDAEKDKIKAKAIIIALGTKRKKLNIKGEQDLLGRGVSYCVACDAFFFKDKTIAVIGGSNCAATSALALSNTARKVYVVYRGKKLRCEDINSKKIEQKKNVEPIYNALPTEIKGKEKVESLVIMQSKKKREIEVSRVFIEIGAEPLTNVFKGLGPKLDRENYILVDSEIKTNTERVFAAGDITSREIEQIVIAASDGAIAAHFAYKYLQG